MIAECIGCREVKEIQERNLCSKCVDWENKHIEDFNNAMVLENTCSKCGYIGLATDLHHIHGRKNSNETVRLCCNCHAELHRSGRMK